MQDLENRLRELGERAIREVPSELRPTSRALRRIRVGRAVRSGAVLATVAALVIGGYAGARSLTSDEALPPAEEDSNLSPFVDTWTTTDVDGRTRTLVIKGSGEDAYEITLQNHLALVCSGAPSTLTGTGQPIGSTRLVIVSPEITCDDGSEPKAGGFVLEEIFRNLTFEHDPGSDIITNFSPLESRRSRPDAGDIYNGLTLVWSRADAENRIGDVSGWITYGDKSGIWARDLRSPGDPADRVRLSSTQGIPIAWSTDGSKLLVLRDNGGLFVLNSDGAQTQPTDFAPGNGADLSPDGATVVYAMGRAIYVMDAEGGTPRLVRSAGERLFEDSRCPEYEGCVGEQRPIVTSLQEPKFSPDGTQIAYFDGIGDSGHSLRVMDIDGTDMRVVVENRMTLDVGHVFGLDWSPDGEHLVFAITDGTFSASVGLLDDDRGVYVVGVDGSGLRRVAIDGLDPYWSPDGSHIAYTRPDPQDPADGRGSLEIVRLDDLQVQNFGDGESGPWTADVPWQAERR